MCSEGKKENILISRLFSPTGAQVLEGYGNLEVEPGWSSHSRRIPRGKWNMGDGATVVSVNREDVISLFIDFQVMTFLF